jgi:glycosyltransferase involved in cell wall biosynthesis
VSGATAGPPVSLLIPNRNNALILDHVLERLASNTDYPDVELVVVDDGSTDGSRELLRRWRNADRFSRFRLIEREHSGVVDTLNAGLAQATGELVVQLDADASIETPGWLQRMVSFFVSDERIGVVTAKVVFDWGEIHTCGVDVIGPDGFHDRGTVITETPGRRTYHQRVARFRDGECGACEEIAEVDGGIGCCMMYRRDVALEVGGYDPGYAPVWFDDLDLTLCIRRRGLKVFYLPDVRVVHHFSRRIAAKSAPRRAALGARKWIGARLPPDVRRGIAQALNIDRPGREEWSRLLHHYGYWNQKWGFDMLNPDMDAVRERWGGTELCWRLDPEMRAAGEQIIAAFDAEPRAGRRVAGSPETRER